MLDGVKQTLDENVAVVSGFPESVVNNRALFLTVANILTFTGNHVRTHYVQMRETIERARSSIPA